ncbi:hypothetical protein Ccrd_023325, partial [Cynara cardunculus var. scolymus]
MSEQGRGVVGEIEGLLGRNMVVRGGVFGRCRSRSEEVEESDGKLWRKRWRIREKDPRAEAHSFYEKRSPESPKYRYPSLHQAIPSQKRKRDSRGITPPSQLLVTSPGILFDQTQMGSTRNHHNHELQPRVEAHSFYEKRSPESLKYQYPSLHQAIPSQKRKLDSRGLTPPLQLLIVELVKIIFLYFALLPDYIPHFLLSFLQRFRVVKSIFQSSNASIEFVKPPHQRKMISVIEGDEQSLTLQEQLMESPNFFLFTIKRQKIQRGFGCDQGARTLRVQNALRDAIGGLRGWRCRADAGFQLQEVRQVPVVEEEGFGQRPPIFGKEEETMIISIYKGRDNPSAADGLRFTIEVRKTHHVLPEWVFEDSRAFEDHLPMLVHEFLIEVIQFVKILFQSSNASIEFIQRPPHQRKMISLEILWYQSCQRLLLRERNETSSLAWMKRDEGCKSFSSVSSAHYMQKKQRGFGCDQGAGTSRVHNILRDAIGVRSEQQEMEIDCNAEAPLLMIDYYSFEEKEKEKEKISK